MNEQEAKNLIRETFQNPFDEARFRLFAINLFNDLDESKAFSYHGQYIPDAYKEHVRQYKRVGKFRDPEGAELDVLIVNLKKEAALDRARTMQRNFIAWYLKKKEREAAIVAYHTDGLEDWRFSYVRMDYRTVEEGDKVKVKEELTPARRYSFLVGRNEPNHTVQQQLLPILQDDRANPTLSELEKAFNIESVTKEFFERYKNLFLKVKEELDALVEADRKIREDFAAKKLETADFAKKLLGQIVFLYFLQKKGWLGVEKDEAGNFKGWGTGPKDFMRRLFDKRIVAYDNFFNDLLEPLFYEALAIDRGVESFYSPFKCKIPFLNGGLFEPICGYNWQETDILVKNEVFAGIFNTFDLYNFTVREDEPLEKEVAVDPEMLGKVFENLLEVKDRKSKGAFYTPREIVHYMCQESLINYLDTEVNNFPLTLTLSRKGRGSFSDIPPPLTGGGEGEGERSTIPIPRADLECFTRHGVFAIEHDRTVEAKGRETRDYQYHLPEAIRMNARLIDKALADIKICDIAIGSGAFPVGILHEIVSARETLTAYIGESPERTRYDFKRHAIQESIYGVDIDASAVDIAKLRLWLSLVVDEENFETIKPLPNLDYKIVCGNSLFGVKRDLLNNHLFKELEALKQQFFDETNPRKKKEEKEKIDRLIKQITNNDEHFDFEIYFSEVFHQQGGFDITIGNPPYVRHEAIKEQKPQLSKQFGSFYCGTADLYTYFYKKGLDELRPGGHLCFIAPNKFMRAGYGKNTRVLLTTEATPKVVIDFGDLPIFDATTYPSILLLEKGKKSPSPQSPPIKGGEIFKVPSPLVGEGRGEGGVGTFLAATFTDPTQLERIEETLATVGFTMPISALRAEGWNLEKPEVLALMEKLRKAGKPLGEYVQGKFYYGIKTGLNEAFVIDDAVRERLIAEDPKSEELIKPWLRGRDIRKWKAEWAGLYLIAIASSANREWPWSNEKAEAKARPLFDKAYPAIHRHLSQFEDKLRKRDDQGKFWWELRSCAYYEEFKRPKIVYQVFQVTPCFLLDNSGMLTNNASYIIPQGDEYLLAYLNSSLGWFMIKRYCASIQNGYQLMADYFGKSLIFPATDAQKAPIIECVKKILAAQEPHPHPDPPLEREGTSMPPRPQGEGWGEGGIVPRLEAEIDRLVYGLYGLTEEEIGVVEGKYKNESQISR